MTKFRGFYYTTIILSLASICLASPIDQDSVGNLLRRHNRRVPDDVWGQWGEWEECKYVCGDRGEQTRRRKCASYDPHRCKGDTKQNRICCYKGPITCGGQWTEWGPWGICSQQCDGGLRTRERDCSAKGRCEGKSRESEACNKRACCTTWAPWSACSVSCGSVAGTVTSKHRCTTYQHGSVSGGYASKAEDRTRACDYSVIPCPNWSEWSDWCECSSSCGGGKTTRERTCTDYKKCRGKPKEEKDCNTHTCPKIGQWEPWTNCDKGCGGGTRKRTRECVTDSKLCLANMLNDPSCICDGKTEETGQCNTHICSSWGEWLDWTQCSVGCGGGKRNRPRTCERDSSFCTPDKEDNVACKCEGKKSEDDPCNMHMCPKWKDWAEWALCSATCNGGTRQRGRECVVDTAYCTADKKDDPDCKCCGPPKEPDLCNTHLCPTWGPWEPWGDCNQNCSGGTQIRERPCMTDTKYCKRKKNDPSCICSEGNGEEPQDCNKHKCPEWTSWTPWSECTNECGGGSKLRTRKCDTDPTFCATNAGHPSCTCEGWDHEYTDCNQHKCPEWTTWGPWQPCTASCGGGTKERKRICEKDEKVCSDPAKKGSPSCTCPGSDNENEPCNPHQCPEWNPWTPWSTCDKPCEGGTKKRTRTCKIDKSFCSVNANDPSCKCNGDKEEDADCNPHKCPEWSPWEPWPPCSASCSGGSHTRTRVCEVDATFCVGDKLKTDPSCKCDGDKDETKDCNPHTCPEWSPWEPWQPCSKTCGHGEKIRQRKCNIDTTYCVGDKLKNDPSCQCPGEEIEKDVCCTWTCPEWAPWTPWNECSVTCSKGVQERTRDCTVDTNHCTQDKSENPECKCAGKAKDTKECDKGECHQWTDWGQWSKCGKVCGGGSRNRARDCPVVGACPGLKEEKSFCNQMPCPDWGSWSPWSTCSVTCGGGQRVGNRACPWEGACSPGGPFRSEECGTGPCPQWAPWSDWTDCDRTCNEGNRKRERLCKPIDGCLGRGIDVEPCFTKPCPLTTHWSAWSPCTQTCGGGTQTRSRASCPQVGCPEEREKQDCEKQDCPNWSEWGAWTDCSKTCGAGARTHARLCVYDDGTTVERGCVGKGEEVDGVPCNNFPCKRRFFLFW